MAVEMEELRQVPIFAPLATDDLRCIAAVTAKRHYDRGDSIVVEGDRDGALCFVRSGLVKVFKTSSEGKEQVLRLIPPGQTFNDVPALDGGLNPASVTALEPSVIFATSGAELR